MKLYHLLIALVLVIFLAACAPETPQDVPDQTATPWLTPTLPPTYTPPPTSTPLPTLTPSPAPRPGKLYTWPAAPLTEKQIQEVLDCEEETWTYGNEVDPRTIEIENPSTACEYALLAISSITDFQTLTLPNEGIIAAQQALLLNPGIILANPYFFYSFQDIGIVAPPPFVSNLLVYARIEYEWNGMGTPVSFDLEINADTSVVVTGVVEQGTGEDSTSSSQEIEQEVSAALFQGLGKSLANLIPISQQGNLFACFDTYPDWTITLRYEDGYEITLKTNGSNYYPGGGPFQIEIDGQDYVLASQNFTGILNQLVTQLALPLGEPMAMTCYAEPIARTLLGNGQ